MPSFGVIMKRIKFILSLCISIGLIFSSQSMALIINGTTNCTTSNISSENESLNLQTYNSSYFNKTIYSNISSTLNTINNSDNITYNLNNSKNNTKIVINTTSPSMMNTTKVNDTILNHSFNHNITNLTHSFSISSNFNTTFNSSNVSKMLNKLGTNNLTNLTNIHNKTKKEYLDVVVKGYKVLVITNGRPHGYSKNMTLKLIKIKKDEYILSPVLLNTTIIIYSRFKDKIVNKSIFLDMGSLNGKNNTTNTTSSVYNKNNGYPNNTNINKKIHYLDIIYKKYKLIVKTNGIPYAKYSNLSLNVNFDKIGKNTYLIYPLILNNEITIYSKYNNESLSKTIFLNYTMNTSRYRIIKRIQKRKIIVKNEYYPRERIRIKLNFMPKIAYIITPNGKILHLNFKKEKRNRYEADILPNEDSTIGIYRLIIDNYSKIISISYCRIHAKYINGSIIGYIKYNNHLKNKNYLDYHNMSKYIIYALYPTNKVGAVKLVDRRFHIRLNRTEIYNTYKIILLYDGCLKEIKLKNESYNYSTHLFKKTVSYDPVNKEIVVKLEGNPNVVKKYMDEFKNFTCSSKIKLNNITICMLKTKASRELMKKYGVPYSALNTTENVEKLGNNKIRVTVNNKLNNVWYRFSCKIPKGYRVGEIVGDDGRVIRNNISINRLTGEISGEIRWYVKNDTLYFYDDPIHGYDISLIPPNANNSIAVEVANNGTYAGGGQISAIEFPYNGTDNASNDHLGRTEDNFGNSIDIDAGGKFAINFTMNGINYQYGNIYYYWQSTIFSSIFGIPPVAYYSDLGSDGNITQLNLTYVYSHTTPNDIWESNILTKMQTEGKELNITQKIIIRGNDRWFATIYYIKPIAGNISNVSLFQGCDWNFNGNFSNDSCYYNSTDDVVYGHDNSSTTNIEYGGFKSDIFSSAHDVNYYTDYLSSSGGGGWIWGSGSNSNNNIYGMWGDIYRSSLNNLSYYSGDAATAMEWKTQYVKQDNIWIVPVIWGLGYTYNDMVYQLDKGLNQLYDTGVKSINYPSNNDVFNPNIQSIIYVNSTIALYGIVDAYNLNVSINISQINGTYSFYNSTLINMTVPYNEEKQIVFPINISNMPYGKYNLTIKTNLPKDQNTSNDQKNIIIYISPFSIEPSIQNKTGNAGKEIFYNITAYNNETGSNFDINISNSTEGWATKIYYNNSLIAEDSNGDGTWDYIANGYDSNSNGLPDIYIPTGNSTITVSKTIPITAPLGIQDLTTLNFTDTNNSFIKDHVSFKTSTPYPPLVHKTFYLHGNVLKTLNTSIPTKILNYTEIYKNSQESWVQSPRFASNFIIYGNIPVLLYMNDSNSTGSHDIIVSLLATNGVDTIDIGNNEEWIYLNGSISPYIFNISLTSPITIPKNYYLILLVENQQSTSPINVFHDIYHPSNITLNTTTYVKVYNIYTNKKTYYVGDNATIFANVTDPIGSYDISGANISVYYPNGTLYINDSMNLSLVDNNTPSLWRLYNYSFNLPVSGNYNISITGIESNGVIYTQNYTINVLPPTTIIEGTIYEDLGKIGINDSSDNPIPNVNVSLVKDNDGNNRPDINDLWICNTTTNSTGNFNFTLNSSSGVYFVVVNSRTVNTTRGLNNGYSIKDIWAEETYQTNDSNYSQIIPFFGGRNASLSDNWSDGIYEHYILINTSKYNSENIKFGFSFDVITNTLDNPYESIQGSFRQFIKNANAIKGRDNSYFEIPKTDPNYDGSKGYYIIGLNESINNITDNNTIINGSSQKNGSIVINGTDGEYYYNIISTSAYNTSIKNIKLVNYWRAVEAINDGCNGLNITNVSFLGKNAGCAIYISEESTQTIPANIFNITVSNPINASSYPEGIYLLDNIWLNIKNSSIYVENGDGIFWAKWISGYSNLTIGNSKISGNYHGIMLYTNGNNTLIYNTSVKNSIYEGIYLRNSKNINILNLINTNNSIGIYVENSSVSIYNNSIFNNKYDGIQGFNATITVNNTFIENQSHGIYLNNSVVNITNTLIKNHAYEGLVSKHTILDIYNLSSYNNSYGIYIQSKNYTKIENSNMLQNNYGLGIVNSSNIVLDSCNVCENNISGIYVSNADNLNITSSKVYNNTGVGILSYGNISNMVVYNTSFTGNGYANIGNNDDYDGLNIQIPSSCMASNVTIISNIFNKNGYANVSNKGYGIYLYSDGKAYNFNISYNFVNSSWRDGIFAFNINNITIFNNNVSYNGIVGGDPAGSGIKIVGYNSSDIYIENNNCSSNEGNGISLEGYYGNYLMNVLLSKNYMSNNGIDTNNGNALFIGGRVDNISVKNNNMRYSDAQAILIQEPNGWNGLYWIGSNISINNNSIEYNGLTIPSGNATAGITIGAYGLYNQDNGYILISNNDISNNNICPNQLYSGKMGGIEIHGLNESWVNLSLNISKNIISNNTAYGILIDASRNITITNNEIYNNEKGITLPSWDSAATNIIISKNSIYNNSLLGIDLNNDNISLNDGLLNSSEPNYGMDYPIITSAVLEGSANLSISGYINNKSAGTGSPNFAYATVEIYLVKTSTEGDNLIGNNISSSGEILPHYYGEGWEYLGTIKADKNGNFNGIINVSGKNVENGSLITATTTIYGLGTSEFGRDCLVTGSYDLAASIWLTPQGYNISVRAYSNVSNVYVYWYKPDNVSVLNITGDYSDNGTNGNTYWFEFDTINANDVKNITITTNTSSSEGLIIGIDPYIKK